MAAKPQPQKLKATDSQYQIKALEDGIVRADKNIVIFSQEVENQKLPFPRIKRKSRQA